MVAASPWGPAMMMVLAMPQQELSDNLTAIVPLRGESLRPATPRDSANAAFPNHAAPSSAENGLARLPPRDSAREGRWNHGLELASGSRRRRVFTAEEKAQIVAESFESSQSVCSVARKHRLTASQLFAWRKDARRRGGRPQAEHAAAFATLAAGVAGNPPPPAAGQTSAIEIAIGPAIVRVRKGADAAILKEVLQLLNESARTAAQREAVGPAEHLPDPSERAAAARSKGLSSAAERAEKVPDELRAGGIARGESVRGSGFTGKAR